MTDPTLDRYAASRRTQAGAESYATKYDRELHKRVSSYFERRAVLRALARTGVTGGLVLDVPCGAGRLTPLLETAARRLVSVDYSPAMVAIHRRRFGERHPEALVGDSFRLPFRDRAFDVVFSARLSHHIGDEALRLEHLREVMRVSAAWTIVTVFDSRSLKNLLRDVRRAFNRKKPPKNTLSREQVASTAAAAGFSVVDALSLSRLASGHVFYVLQRA